MNISKLKIVLFTLLLLLLFFALPQLVNLYGDFLWFKELGYQALFIKTLLAKLIIGIVTFLLVTLLAFLTLYLTLNLKQPLKIKDDNLIDLTAKKGGGKLLIILPSLLLGILAGLLASTALWENILLFLNQAPFGVSDPVFNRDLSFYFFNLSLYETIFALATLFLLVIAILNFVFTVYLQGLGNNPIKTAVNRLGYFVIAFFLLLIIGYQLKLANLLYSPRGAAFGAAYTDLMVTLPYYYIASAVCVLSAILIFIGIRKKNFKLVTLGPILLVIVVILGGVAQNLVQSFIVNPNEINKELDYISRSITMTNQAFGLDKIEEIEFPAETNLTLNDLEEASETLNNVRINDFRPAKTIFNQLQSMRPYYDFLDVDVDRYTLNGQSTQVFLSARELNQNNIPAQGQTWINKYLKYTHGYGAVVAPVNKITPQGQPLLLVKDIPPVSQEPELDISRPEIYYGQLTNDFVIVNTSEKEFDYPVGNDNAETTYEGTAGIPLKGINKIIFALKKGSFKLLVSGALTNESKILLYRNIQQRVEKIAPFLSYDQDPYLVINGGKLYWIIDAYTISTKYPYSEPLTDNRYSGVNYIRNSVKVVVDAYNGSVNYYLVDEKDPIVQSYANVFPDLFKPYNDMPQGIKEHIRYPIDLFDLQTQVFQDFHMKNPRVFYNREDSWSIAKEQYQENIQTVNPYFINMKLPGSDKLEFLMMRPFTPIKKDNMIAWLAARNDDEKYGQLILFKFPKQRLVYGPMQIESRINQDSTISRDLTLWGQSGSSVIRGNLLVIPIKDSLIYIEPLYIQSENANSLPEVKRIIVAYQENIVMEETLEEALYQIFKNKQQSEVPDGTPETEFGIKILARQAREAYEKAKAAAQAGDWALYGSALQELENVISQIENQVEEENLLVENDGKENEQSLSADE
ncbi:MAG: hypothetical protein JM58_18025 [Peptococcaceae bacterium BICA1-8]|nr:MAG: hypothetical protein JM58_18025 [Peptococcaceae bacterium BICA1-8]